MRVTIDVDVPDNYNRTEFDNYVRSAGPLAFEEHINSHGAVRPFGRLHDITTDVCPQTERRVEARLPINFINLDRSRDRLAEFKSLNAHLTNCERFPAVDGRILDIPTLVNRGLVTADIVKDYTIGNVGAAMSNIALWDRAIDSGRIVTAAEDDAIFNFGFERQAAEIVGRLPDDWDFILWGYNFDLFMCFQMLPGASPCLALFEQDMLRRGVKAFQNQTIQATAYRLIWAFGLACYSISPKGAREFKSRCLPLRPQIIHCPEIARAPPGGPTYRTVGIDNHMNGVHRDLKSFVCFPPLVVTKNEREKSTVQEPR
jgi:GR25 family glycosyltransferase involved in LPS biosynthesis